MQTISHEDRCIGCLLGTGLRRHLRRCGGRRAPPAKFASFMARFVTLPSPEEALAGTRTIRKCTTTLKTALVAAMRSWPWRGDCRNSTCGRTQRGQPCDRATRITSRAGCGPADGRRRSWPFRVCSCRRWIPPLHGDTLRPMLHVWPRLSRARSLSSSAVPRSVACWPVKWPNIYNREPWSWLEVVVRQIAQPWSAFAATDSMPDSPLGDQHYQAAGSRRRTDITRSKAGVQAIVCNDVPGGRSRVDEVGDRGHPQMAANAARRHARLSYPR